MKNNCGIRKRGPTNSLLTQLILLFVMLCIVTPAMAADWAAVYDMNYGRHDTNAVRLNDGRVFYGGEFYDPATGAWTIAEGGSPGYLSTETLLLDGRVLVAGDYDLWWSGALPYAQLYDPSTDTWRDTTNSIYSHGGHLAVRLRDGRVLVAGNRDGGTGAEIFNPLSETWTDAGNMNTGHAGGFIELLPNGKVMVGGGANGYGGTAAGIEFFNPSRTKAGWKSMSNPPGLWFNPSSVRLNDGRILVVSGNQSYLYNSASNSWTEAANLNVEHTGHFSLTGLADGQVLAAGGEDFPPYIGNAAEIYNPLSDSWTRISDMPENRANHGAVLLANGHVLLAGGTHGLPICCDIISSLLYTPPGSPPPPVSLPLPIPTVLSVHVSDLDSASEDRVSIWVPKVVVTVFNHDNQPEGGAKVTGFWDSGFTDPISCTTSSSGTCTVSNIAFDNVAGAPPVVFTVTDVARTGKDYDSAANSDPDGDSDGTTITINPPPPPPPPTTSATTVFVGDMDGSSVITSTYYWQATVTITLLDENGNAVNDAAVFGHWSGTSVNYGVCYSDVNGICTVVVSNIPTPSLSASSSDYVQFKVMSITHATLTYDASANSDPDGDSDGKTIKIYRP